jgi:THO complex subunit 4
MFVDTDASYPAKAAAGAARGAGIETGTKILISNLDYGVSNDDIKELYAEVGDIKRCGVHYDRSGRSEGTAEVVFARRGDAVAAVKRYNTVQLDGKPMKVEIVGTNIASGPARSSASNGVFGREIGALRSGQGRGFAGRPRGGGGGRGPRRGHGRGRGRGGGGEKVSAEDLDADLEKYHAESMETN